MPKANLSPEEVKQMISLEVGSNTAQIAEGVFHKLFEGVKKEMDAKVSPLVYGGLIASGVLLVSIFGAMFIFMSSYQQHYLDTETALTEKIDASTKENTNLRLDVQDLKNQLDYLERSLLQK